MIDLARQIREQLRRHPDRKCFHKRRDTLLEIAVALECANKALQESDRRIRHLENMLKEPKTC